MPANCITEMEELTLSKVNSEACLAIKECNIKECLVMNLFLFVLRIEYFQVKIIPQW